VTTPDPQNAVSAPAQGAEVKTAASAVVPGAPARPDVEGQLQRIVALCAELGIEVVCTVAEAPDWKEKGDPAWSTPEQDERPCAAIWFASFDDVVEFQQAPNVVIREFGCDWGNYGPFGFAALPHTLGLRSERGVWGKAVPHADLADLVVGLERAVEQVREEGGITPPRHGLQDMWREPYPLWRRLLGTLIALVVYAAPIWGWLQLLDWLEAGLPDLLAAGVVALGAVASAGMSAEVWPGLARLRRKPLGTAAAGREVAS
jgi:hypothetical protein